MLALHFLLTEQFLLICDNAVVVCYKATAGKSLNCNTPPFTLAKYQIDSLIKLLSFRNDILSIDSDPNLLHAF